MLAGRASRHPLAGLPAAATDGSILLSRPERQFTNSDAFFAFSAIQVRFGQVAAWRTIVLIAWPRNRGVHLIAHAALQCNRTACVRFELSDGKRQRCQGFAVWHACCARTQND
jgi:hypothetical protein